MLTILAPASYVIFHFIKQLIEICTYSPIREKLLSEIELNEQTTFKHPV